MKKQAGFTLIELIAVIVILAILAITAVPQFVDLRDSARNASAAGVGGAISSGSALNYAKGVAQGGASTVTDCSGTALAPLIGATGAATTVTVGAQSFTVGTTTAPATSGQAGTCTIVHGGGGAAQSFAVIGCATATCG